MSSPPPPLTGLADVTAQLGASGWVVLDAPTLCGAVGLAQAPTAHWAPHWHELPPDQHLKDGGRYRRRRHASFVVEDGRLRDVPHRAHWQPVAYNALHGGLERWFEPVPPALLADAAWRQLMCGLAGVATQIRPAATGPWFGEAHLFRIDTSDGIGRPTPEGAHRDGVELVAVLMMGRHGIKGGETRVFDARGPQGVRFTLMQPFSALLLDDERVIHETTPIQPLQAGATGWRDTLVITLRRGGFQDPEPTR